MSDTIGTVRVLLVDGDPEGIDPVAASLEREDDRLAVRTVTTAEAGLERLDDVDCVVSGYDLPDRNGVEFLEAVRDRAPTLPFILHPDEGSEAVASDAISAGVTDYLRRERGTDQGALLADRIRNGVEEARAEHDHERMHERMELALEHSDSIIFDIDLDTGAVVRHGAFEEFFGLPTEEVPTWEDYVAQIVHPDDRDAFRQFYRELFDGDRTGGTVEYRTNPEFGHTRWLEDIVSTEAVGDTRQAVGLVRDVTERTERERELRRSERRYRAVFDDPNILVALLDTDGTVLDVNRTAMEYVDVERAAVLDEPFWETPWFNHPDTARENIRKRVERAAGGEYVEFRADRLLPNGDPYVVEGVFRPVTDEEGNVVALLISSRDVTEQREREKELERIREFFREAERLGDLGAWEFDANGNSVWTEGTRRIHEVDDEFDPTVEGGLEFYHPDDREKIERAVERAVEEGESYDVQARLITAAGNERWVRTGGRPLDDGDVVRGYIQDITEQRERERELEQRTAELEELAEELEEQYRNLFEEAPVMAVVTRADDGMPVVEDCNRRFVETLGYEKEEIIGQDLGAFYTDESRRALEDGGYERAMEGDFMREDRELVTADGDTVETLLRAVPRYNAGDERTGTLGLYVDVSERRDLEREKSQLEEFTSIVSHDLRNPLDVAHSYAELAQDECDTEYLDGVMRAHDHMATLIDDLLTLARSGRQVGDLEAVTLGSCVERGWRNVATDDATHTVTTEREVLADPSRLDQLFENLIANAVEHGGPGVSVTVGELEGGFYVADDGPGIPEDERDKVFEAAYSTSESGTGFGLSIVEQVVEAHGWEIGVAESEAGGARFEVTGVEFADERPSPSD